MGAAALLGPTAGTVNFTTSRCYGAAQRGPTPHGPAPHGRVRAALGRIGEAVPGIAAGHLGGAEPLTLEEVGRTFGVTRERIRQIENNTLKKLKRLPEAQMLRDAS